jgi:hypothetical protein
MLPRPSEEGFDAAPAENQPNINVPEQQPRRQRVRVREATVPVLAIPMRDEAGEIHENRRRRLWNLFQQTGIPAEVVSRVIEPSTPTAPAA